MLLALSADDPDDLVVDLRRLTTLDALLIGLYHLTTPDDLTFDRHLVPLTT